MDPELIAIVALAFVGGGILKGVTGCGAPLLAVPVMAVSVDMAFVITIFSIPNVLPNLWQAWRFRAYRLPRGLLLRFTGAAALGSGIGTMALVMISQDILSALLAVMILVYLGFRLWQPDWKLPVPAATRLAIPAGCLGGLFQSASGLSAPVSLTYLSAMRLERPVFVQTIATFFVAVGLVQVPALLGLGYLTLANLGLSIAALAPLAAGMWLGARLAARINAAGFQRIIMAILLMLAARLLWGVVA